MSNYLHIVLLMCGLGLLAGNTCAQDSLANPAAVNTNGFDLRFVKPELEFGTGEMVSNVLIVTNTKSEAITFSVDVSAPADWKLLYRKNQQYTINPGDSLFIPVRILPKANLRGSTRFMFSVFVFGSENQHLGFAYFYAVTRKNISWALSPSDQKIYLLNNQEKVDFDVLLMNTGTDEQDIHFSMKTMAKSAEVIDSAGTTALDRPITFQLKSNEDTTLKYTFFRDEEPRNFRMLDLEDYNPYIIGDEQKYTLFVNSTSPNPADHDRFRASDKIDIVKLSDNFSVNPYGTDVLPLVADLNAFNLLGSSPMMSLHLRGQSFLNESSSLVYHSQLTYMSNYFTSNPYENATYYLGYFHKKFNVQIGNISGGVLGTHQGGEGIKGEYIIDRKQKVGLFFTNSPRIFRDPAYTTFGFNHSYISKQVRVSTQFGHSIDRINNRFTDAMNVNAGTSIVKNHSFGVRLGGSRNVEQDSVLVTYGFMSGLYYSGSFLDKKLTSGINAMYQSPGFGLHNYERFTLNTRNEYRFNDKWSVALKNNLYRYKSHDTTTTLFNYQLNNQAVLVRTQSKAGNFSPLIFYNVSRLDGFRVHSRGVGFNAGKYDVEMNNRYFINMKTGYNRAVDTLSKDYFFLQLGGFVQFRTFSFNARYHLGNFTVSKNFFLYNSVKNPQHLTLSARHQYVFSKPWFVIQNQVGFSYGTLSGRTFTYSPEVYYFAKGGWRFKVFADFALAASSNADISEIYYPVSGEEEDSGPTWTQSWYVGAGIRKEFGIPIPKTRKKYASPEFTVFYDLNGDGKKDRNEDVIENVVIKVEAWEVISNAEGQATLKNVPAGAYPCTVFSLTDLQGWFPHIDDTLFLVKSGPVNIPFTRGVKITGKVFIDREKVSEDLQKNIDLSRIKVSAINDRMHTTLTDADGNFSIYLPYGKYILTMDEKILGEKFQLVQNNFELTIDEKFDNLFVPFYIIEKKRKIKIKRFDANGNLIPE